MTSKQKTDETLTPNDREKVASLLSTSLFDLFLSTSVAWSTPPTFIESNSNSNVNPFTKPDTVKIDKFEYPANVGGDEFRGTERYNILTGETEEGAALVKGEVPKKKGSRKCAELRDDYYNWCVVHQSRRPVVSESIRNE